MQKPRILDLTDLKVSSSRRGENFLRFALEHGGKARNVKDKFAIENPSLLREGMTDAQYFDFLFKSGQ